ncbi:MAG: hypothetical protein ACYTGX_08505, partial [Planctomycetota bacterium]
MGGHRLSRLAGRFRRPRRQPSWVSGAPYTAGVADRSLHTGFVIQGHEVAASRYRVLQYLP